MSMPFMENEMIEMEETKTTNPLVPLREADKEVRNMVLIGQMIKRKYYEIFLIMQDS